MPDILNISLAPERMAEGDPAEQAAFGLLTIQSSGRLLTEGFDHYINGYRPGPLVSGYHLAEWLAWNWWRLRYEPRSASAEWWRAHRMTSIGEGYAWPDIEIFSDGVRTALLSSPSSQPDSPPFRYIGAPPIVIPSTVFEVAVDLFIPQILGRLRGEGVQDTNLDHLWQDVLAERADPDLARRRRLEALLGYDADNVDEAIVEQLLADADRLGESAIQEIAADSAQQLPGRQIRSANDFARISKSAGFAASPSDGVSLPAGVELPRGGDVSAWHLGVAAARAVRASAGLGCDLIRDSRLAEISGIDPRALQSRATGGPRFSFALDYREQSHISLRPAGRSGRRFDVARLLGDRLVGSGNALHPATTTDTYKQKMQRSFAAELLSPFDMVDNMLAGDYSDETQKEVADHFRVSEMTINTLLRFHGKIPRTFGNGIDMLID